MFDDEYEKGKTKREFGMDLAASNSPVFSHLAYKAIYNLALTHPTLHIDDVLQKADVPTPKSPNAWGSVWMKAIRTGVLERTSELRPCRTDSKKHVHQYPVYKSCICLELFK